MSFSGFVDSRVSVLKVVVGEAGRGRPNSEPGGWREVYTGLYALLCTWVVYWAICLPYTPWVGVPASLHAVHTHHGHQHEQPRSASYYTFSQRDKEERPLP